MANAIDKYPVSQSLWDTVDQNEHIEEVHFTADGAHHFRAFECVGLDGKTKGKYTRLTQVPEVAAKSGITTGKFVFAPILDKKNAEDVAHVVTDTYTRDEILATDPVPDKRQNTIIKADLIAALGEMTMEEIQAVLDAKAKIEGKQNTDKKAAGKR